jgi:ligand-binding sensor domain-containing protein/signal transduction histidine kinase
MLSVARLRPWILLLLAAITAHGAWALDPNVPLRQDGAQVWQTESGLPQNTVHAILQTRDGFLWIATEGGLVRFDGEDFAVYNRKRNPQLPSDVVYGLMQDRAGTLWISTSGGIASYAHGQFHSYPETSETYTTFQDASGRIWALTANGVERLEHGAFKDVLPATIGEASQIIQTKDGTLWLATDNGLLRAPAGAASFTSIGPQVSIRALAVAANGEVWAATGTGVEVCTTHQCRPLHPAGLPDPVYVSALTPVGQNMWVGTDQGLFQIKGNHAHGYHTQQGLPSDQVNLLYKDRQGALWIGTSRGVARFTQHGLEVLPESSELAGNMALTAYEDREGDLWLGFESNGLGILRSLTFTNLTVRDGLAGSYLLSVTQGDDGAIWAGTNGAGLSRYSHGHFQSLTTEQGLSSNVVLALTKGLDGTLWVGTPDGFDILQHDKVLRDYTTADGLPDDFVRSLYVDTRGALWIGSRRGLTRFYQGHFTTFTQMDGLGSNLVGAMLQDRTDGALWIGTLDGLTRYANGSFENFTTHNGLSSNIVTALYQDPQNVLWIATKGGGLNRYRKGHFEQISSKLTGLPDSIYAILGDKEGYLWLSSTHGIYRVSRAALNRFAEGQTRHLPFSVFGASDGMGISECSRGGHPAAWQSTDGRLWFATLKGLAVVNPAHMELDHVPPKVAIEQVSIDDQPVPMGSALKVPPGHSRIEIHYAGLSFVAPRKVHYRYKLLGFDQHWVDAGTQRTAFYTNLAPGRYTFRITAANQDGLWSRDTAEIQFTVMPRIYQTWWFRVVMVITLLLLIYLVYWLRVRSVRAQFQAVLGERTRIAREIHDTLAQGFAAVSVQLEVVSQLLPTSVDAARKSLDATRALVRTSLEEARASIWDLRSQSAEKETLATRIRIMADQVTAQKKVKTQLQVSGIYRPLAPQVEAEIEKIAREAVVNAVRHSNAQLITLRLIYDARDFEMTVRDNGRGFTGAPPEGASGHFGITGMRERAEKIGARLEITSKPGRGTEVRLNLRLGKQD